MFPHHAVVFLGFLTNLNSAWALCDQQLHRFVSTERVELTQTGLRDEAEFQDHLRYAQANGTFKEPIRLNFFPDGRVFVRDGHHRLEVAKTLGWRTLEEGRHFVRENDSYESYRTFNLADGWTTPFDPRTHVRLAQLSAFRSLIRAFEDHGLSQAWIEQWIRSHPESYSISKPELASSDQPTDRLVGGDLRDVEQYFAAMDKTLPSKIAQSSVILPEKGIIYEPGTSTGSYGAAIAAYNPHVQVIGSDLLMPAVRRIQMRYLLPNFLSFHANALDPNVFPENFLDGWWDSSLKHEISSYNDFDETQVQRYHDLVERALKPGRKYGSRDFIAPRWPARVRVALSQKPRSGEPPYGVLSLADLFRSFTQNFRTRDFNDTLRAQEVGTNALEQRVFEAPGEFVANFLLRVNYTSKLSWEGELKEQYTYFDAEEAVGSLQKSGLRVDYAGDVDNEYIRKNWWESNGVTLTDAAGGPIDYPATNFLTYATKPSRDDPTTLEVQVRQTKSDELRWLKFLHFKRSDMNAVRTIVDVPGLTQTYVPHFKRDGKRFIYLLKDVERPALVRYMNLSSFKFAVYGGFASDSIAQVTKAGRDPVEGLIETLARKASIPNAAFSQAKVRSLARYFPSPGGTNEQVDTFLIDLNGCEHERQLDSTKVQALELNQLLASIREGAIPNPKLEVATYALARAYKEPLTSWGWSALGRTAQDLSRLKRNARFHPYESSAVSVTFEPSIEDSHFIAIESVRSTSVYADGRRSTKEWEFVKPKDFSVDTASVIPYAIDSKGKAWIGLERRWMESFHARGISPETRVIPAWRLPKQLKLKKNITPFLSEKLASDFGIQVLGLTPIGAGYFPSSGNMIERVAPYAAEVDANATSSLLEFVPIEALLAKIDRVPDLHTRVSVYRLAHALGVLTDELAQE